MVKPTVEKMERWVIEVVVPVGLYSGADEMITDLTALVEGTSEIEVISAELHENQEMPE